MRQILEAIVTDRAIEARWLNTISMLEFIGARKISRTVAARHPDARTLEHLTDETRHAHAFKQLADWLTPGEACQEYLCAEEAISYFQRLDQSLSAWLRDELGVEDQVASYLMTTTLIERRAMRLYPLYRSITPHERVQDELQRVILEEANHRKALEEDARALIAARGFQAGLTPCVDLEEQLLGEFEGALRARLALD